MHAGSPSSPTNLTFLILNESDNSMSVRLQWDPPLNNGGAPITGYQIFINSSEDVLVSSDTEATIILNSTGVYFIQIRAINCIGISPNLSVLINITGIYIARFEVNNWIGGFYYRSL